MKIYGYFSAIAVSALMCCCGCSVNKGDNQTGSEQDSVSATEGKTITHEVFVPVEGINPECYVDKLSYAICIDCDVLDQFRTMSIYGPEKKQDEKMPVVVFVEGEVKDMPSFEWARIFTELGYKVAIPKCSNIKADRNNDKTIKTLRTSLNDLHDAIHTMNTKADKYGIDTTRIFLAGNASGAHLVTSFAYTYVPGAEINVADGVKGVISISTSSPLNFNEFEKNFSNNIPCLIFHGTSDQQSSEIINSKQLYSQLGDMSDLILVEGAREFPTSDYTKVVKDSCRTFLKELTTF